MTGTHDAAGAVEVTDLNEAMRLVEYDMLNRRMIPGDGFVGERKEVAAIITALRHRLSQPQSGDVGAMRKALDEIVAKNQVPLTSIYRRGDGKPVPGTQDGPFATIARRALPNPAAPPQADSADAVRRAALERLANRIEDQARCLIRYAEQSGYDAKPVPSVFHSQAVHFLDLSRELRALAAGEQS